MNDPHVTYSEHSKQFSLIRGNSVTTGWAVYILATKEYGKGLTLDRYAVTSDGKDKILGKMDEYDEIGQEFTMFSLFDPEQADNINKVLATGLISKQLAKELSISEWTYVPV